MPLYSSLVTEAFMEIYGIATAPSWRICCPAQEDTQTFLQPKVLGSLLATNSTRLPEKHK